MKCWHGFHQEWSLFLQIFTAYRTLCHYTVLPAHFKELVMAKKMMGKAFTFICEPIENGPFFVYNLSC